jgi:hypothetical protein
MLVTRIAVGPSKLNRRGPDIPIASKERGYAAVMIDFRRHYERCGCCVAILELRNAGASMYTPAPERGALSHASTSPDEGSRGV